MITVILNAYKRTNFLELQINSLKKQSIKPEKIFLWNNTGKEIKHSSIDLEVVSSKNLGVWARFSLALNADTKFISIIDDDTIPCNKWFENCISSMEQKEGIYGARGVKFFSESDYLVCTEKGIYGPCDSIEKVDIVGHSWFFKRKWLPFFWLEMPEKDQSKYVGEDINLSYALKKHLNLNTFVPPHPKSNKDLWGSLKDQSLDLGQMEVAISKNKKHLKEMNEIYRLYIKKGFEINPTNNEIIKGNLLKFKKFIGDIIKNRN